MFHHLRLLLLHNYYNCSDNLVLEESDQKCVGLYGKLRLFITDFDILASKILEKWSSAQKQGINKKSLPIFIFFNIGWVFQSTNFTVIL